VDPQVHELVLRGRYTLSNAASEQDLRKAVSLFEQALAKDPANAAAYAGLAYCHIGFTDFYLPPWETMPRAKAAALRALEIDETLADAHTALGGVSFAYDWNWTAAERELRRAIELNPNSAEARDYYALYLSDLGRSEEALAEIRKARELDPLSVMIHVDAINEFFSLHRYDEAVERGRMALELDPGNGNARVMLAIVLVQQGRLREAVAEAEKAIQSGDSPLVLATAGGVFPAAGDPGRARRILGELAEVSKKRYVCPYEIGVIHLALGEKDEAFRWLEKGFRDRSICMQGTRQDPRLEPLHGDPRYEDLLRRLAYPTNPQMPPPARTPR
jgi:tetratricopeptide (TPR) repeat protein